MSRTSTSQPGEPGAIERPLLAIRDLTIGFGPSTIARPVVDGVSLSIHSRQTLAVVGESGCGKSITALSILRLLPPEAQIEHGSIEFHGRDLLARTEQEMLSVRGGQIAMIFQEPMTSLNPVFSIGEQIVEAVMLHQSVSLRQAREIAADALHEVHIANPVQRLKAYPHQFSGGMRQRVMIAMALACRPKLLLADEPTTALDVTVQAQILELLGNLQRERGMAIMLITHDLGLVAAHADVVCVMYAGHVVEYGPAQEVMARPLHPYTSALRACRPRIDERIARLPTVPEIIGGPEAFQPLQNGATPWWPKGGNAAPAAPAPRSHARSHILKNVRMSPAAGALEEERREDSPALVEIEPLRWVACRMDDGSRIALTLPVVQFRRSSG